MSIRPIDLRSVLDYVPIFRNHIFVISLDGDVIDHTMFPSLVKDIAVLHSLNIKVVICHGIANQLRAIAKTRSIQLSDERGEGSTDDDTIRVAVEANALALSLIHRELATNNLPFVHSNALSVRPVGIINGMDQKNTGVCEKLDSKRVFKQLENLEIPVFSPVVHDEKGRTLRINSDNVAAYIASALGASKLIYLSTKERLLLDGKPILNCSAEFLAKKLKSDPGSVAPEQLTKATQAIKVLAKGTNRVHILDGTHDGCLLVEIFDKVGLGTMIHSNEYDRIRAAEKNDIPQIYSLVQQASRTQSLVNKSLEDLTKNIDHFYVYEVDETIIGCTSLIPYSDPSTAELASVCVSPFQQGKGIGQKLAEYTVNEAKSKGYARLFALSTQASEFFTDCLGFKIDDVEVLPKSRYDQYLESHRNSVILSKIL